jgi:hypothetical protein
MDNIAVPLGVGSDGRAIAAASSARHSGDRVAGHAATSITVLFAATLLLGSALMFVVEPMFARMILPRLGGSPTVWNTCVVFFQSMLLAGYVYAHALSRLATLRKQIIVHAALVVLAALALPVGPLRDWLPPVDSSPIPWLLLTLIAGVGAPFLMLSATSPLLQHWFAQSNHPAARDPYHLYAASNIGSIVALLGYPLVIEPFLSLTHQSSGWTLVYWMFAALVIACVSATARFGTVTTLDSVDDAPADVERIGWRERSRWVMLAAVPSSLLLSVTTYLSTDVAAVPLLWTVPLTLYLLTFVCAFARRQVISPRLAQRALPLTLIPLVLVMATAPGGIVLLLFPLHLAVFFLCALTLHTRLANRRPAPHHLTEFYLWIGVGGVVGGLATTFIAPLVFTGVSEYPIGLVGACLLQALARQETTDRPTRRDFALPALVAGAVLAATTAVRMQLLHPGVFATIIVLLGFFSFSFSRRPLRFGLAVGALLLTSVVPMNANGVIYANRTFFGILRVQDAGSADRHMLVHGNTVHGEQDLRPGRSQEPLTYYHRSGPIGQVIAALGARLDGAKVGVVGLGAGSLAAYARTDQQWTFFEIDPAVAAIARDRQLFTYLQPCGDRCRIVLGDARLSLARNGNGPYALLVLDAFSSDAIPVHLMTRQAFTLYLSRLRPDGVLAFHISNRHLDLGPVLASLAEGQNLVALEQYDQGSRTPDDDGHFASRWMVMARGAEALAPLTSDSRWHRVKAGVKMRVWTDDYSNVLTVLRF